MNNNELDIYITVTHSAACVECKDVQSVQLYIYGPSND